VVGTEENPSALLVEEAQVTEYKGKDNYPKKSREQTYRLIPSIDTNRVDGVRFDLPQEKWSRS
jgi:hypothetical protein